MIYHQFPDLHWLKLQAENRFENGKAWNGDLVLKKGWPNVVLNVKAGETWRDNIPGPISLFSNVAGTSEVSLSGRTTRVSNDYFFLTNSGQRYTLEVEKKLPAETFNIHFGESWMESVFAGLTLTHSQNLELSKLQRVEFYNKLYPKDDVIRAIQSRLTIGDRSKLETEEILTQLIVHLLHAHHTEKIRCDLIRSAKASTREEIIRRLHRATDHIYSAYQDDLSLEDLANASMMSKFHFLRSFKEVFGIAPHKFLIQVRLEKAKWILANENLEIGTVGKLTGFKDASSFSRVFKTTTGVYPTAWREMAGKKPLVIYN